MRQVLRFRRHVTTHEADLLLQDQILRLPVAARQGDYNCGAHGRMAGEGQLRRRREDVQMCRMRRISRGKDEHGFRQAELPRDRLHAGCIKVFAPANDRERVAGEALVREDIEGGEMQLHQKCLVPAKPHGSKQGLVGARQYGAPQKTLAFFGDPGSPLHSAKAIA